MKKGMAAEILIFMTAVIISIVLSTLLFNIFLPFKRVDIDKEKNTYLLLNALKTAKVYVESSLDFSVYQTVYNNSRYGGYHNISEVLTMKNELLPLCKKYLDQQPGCVKPNVKEENESIHTGLEKGEASYNVYPAGLLQCVLSMLRRGDTGEIYDGLSQSHLKDIKCKFEYTTVNGLKGFQKDHGLDETGELNDETLEKLEGIFTSKWGDCSKFFFGCEDNVKKMVFWKAVPSEQDLLNELKKGIKEMMESYLKEDYNFLDERVNLPVYENNDITIEKKDYGFLNITLKSSDSISITKEYPREMERINMQVSSNMSKGYPIRYTDLYEIAKDTFNELKLPYRYNCDSYIPGDKLKYKESLSGFTIDAEVFDREESPCKLTVKVSIEDTTMAFPVFNGTDVSFEPVTFEYLAEIT
ncbi:MAG: peptidoglycan-binding domain-containing protein [Candidatus Aenigmarchaeota archaeon]